MSTENIEQQEDNGVEIPLSQNDIEQGHAQWLEHIVTTFDDNAKKQYEEVISNYVNYASDRVKRVKDKFMNPQDEELAKAAEGIENIIARDSSEFNAFYGIASTFNVLIENGKLDHSFFKEVDELEPEIHRAEFYLSCMRETDADTLRMHTAQVDQTLAMGIISMASFQAENTLRTLYNAFKENALVNDDITRYRDVWNNILEQHLQYAKFNDLDNVAQLLASSNAILQDIFNTFESLAIA